MREKFGKDRGDGGLDVIRVIGVGEGRSFYVYGIVERFDL